MDELFERVRKATEPLSVDELGTIINHLGDGTFELLSQEPWYHHVAPLIPDGRDPNDIHDLWVYLINVHDIRFLAVHRR